MNNKGQSRYRNVELYKHHCAWSSENHPALHLTPLKIALYAPNMKTRELHVPQMIGDMDFYVLFPNFVILLRRLGSSASYITYHFWPVAVDRTVWEVRIHFQEPATVRERLQQEYFKCISRDTLQEDTVAHENVHAGLASRAKSHAILQDTEIPIRHFHRVLEDHVAFSRCA